MFCVSGPDGTFTIKLTAEEFDLRHVGGGVQRDAVWLDVASCIELRIMNNMKEKEF